MLFSVTSCTKVSKVQMLPGKLTSKSSDHPIQFFSTQTPNCPYEEIAMVSLSRNKANKLRNIAREMGGDAVVNVRISGYSTGAVLVGNAVIKTYRNGLSGIVIRWLHEDCKE